MYILVFGTIFEYDMALNSNPSPSHMLSTVGNFSASLEASFVYSGIFAN